LVLRIGFVVGRRVQKRQQHRIGAEIVHIPEGLRNLIVGNWSINR
jgi:hypothetical protein